MPETTTTQPPFLQTASDEARAALAPTIERGTKILRAHPEYSLTDLAAEITEEPPLHDPLLRGGVMPFPPLPDPVVLTEADLEALKALPSVFGKTNLTERRMLTDAENEAVFREQQVVKAVLAVMGDREEALKEMVRTSLDVQAEAESRAFPQEVRDDEGNLLHAASPRDQHGHYVLGQKGAPERLPIPGTNKAWSREMRGGTTSIDARRLVELYENEAITKEEYYAFTREVRVFDESKARKSIDRNPALLGLLARITKRGGVSAALFTRKK